MQYDVAGNNQRTYPPTITLIRRSTGHPDLWCRSMTADDSLHPPHLDVDGMRCVVANPGARGGSKHLQLKQVPTDWVDRCSVGA